LKLFGFEIKRKEDAVETQITSFAEPLNDDGALTVGTALGGSYGMLLDLEGSAKNEAELVTRYRTMTLSPEIQQAVDEVVNEAISVNTFEKVVEVVLDDVEVADRVKERIFEEFDNILKLLDFSNNAYEIFAKFYVDGRLNYHAVIDEKNLKKGIVELRYLDPRKIRLIREVEQTPIKGQGMVATTKRVRSEYYMYSDNGFGAAMGTSQSSNSSVAGLRIAKDSIIRVTSGLLNETNSVVFSYLHRAIKPLNQLRMLEDANVIYTLVRSPERRVFYIDVGNLPKAKAEQYLHDMMARHKNKVVYDPTSGEIRDDRKMMTMTEDYWFPRREGCFDLSTKVDLLDGRSVEIGQLIVEHKAGKENWTFSISPDGKVVPGKISWAGVTRNDTQVLDVYLDNGEIITATPDHKFILRTGEKIEAKDLVSGSSLMPFNKKMKGINQNAGAKDYLQVQNNDDESWVYSHRMVNEYFNGPTQKGNVIHHIDNHRFNNNPENLIEMGKTEHLKLHTSMAKYGWRDEVYDSHCENLSIAGKEFFKTDAGFKRRKEITDFNNQSEAVWNGLRKGREVIKMLRDEDKKILSKDEYLSKWSKGLTSEVGIQASKMAVEKIKRDRENLTAAEFKQKYSNRGGSRANYNNKVGDISLEQFASILKTVLSKNVNAKNKNIVNVFCEMTGKNISYSTLMYYVSSHGYETLSHFIYRYCGAQYTSKRRLGHVTKSKRSGNHTVVKVAYRDDLIDVGTLTIDGDHLYHDYHNFALSSGIFVMNSRTTEIETLPSAGTLGDNEQLSYFQNKLYRALNVPVGRLQPENMYTFGRASEITREELRFSKFIKRLRIRFSIIFDKCLERQLVLKGIITPDEWSDIQNSIRYDFMKDNFFEELKESEILREKLTTLREVDEHVGKYFSRSWVKKNVLFFTDDEVKDMDKEIAKEKADGLYDDGMDDDDDGMDGPEDDVSPPTKDDTDQEPDDEPEEQEAEESFINRGIVSKFSKGPIKK
jgi:hypothetical protein